MPVLTAQFVGTRGFVSRMVEWKGAGRYSHVDLVMPNENLLGARSDRTGGKPSGVQVRPPNYEAFDPVTRIDINVFKNQEDRFWSFAMAQVGKPYDRLSILGFMINRDWMQTDSWICSELAMAAYASAGIFNHPLAVPNNKIDPSTAFAILSTWGTVRQIASDQ